MFFGVSQEQELPLINRDGDRVGFIKVIVEQSDDSVSPKASPGRKCPSPLFGPTSEGGQRKGHSVLHFGDAEYARGSVSYSNYCLDLVYFK